MSGDASSTGCGVVVVLGDESAVEQPVRDLRHGRDVVMVLLATANATAAEVAAVQLPKLDELKPSRVVLQLGWRDLLDGFDESYFHARVVELCDGIKRAVPQAEVDVIGVPKVGTV